MQDLEDARIFVCDDDDNTLVAARHFLSNHVKDIQVSTHPKEMMHQLQNFDIILMDMNYAKGESKGKEGFFWLNEIQKTNLDVLIICMTNNIDVEMAVQSLHEGATDFILKPMMREKLFASIINAMKLIKSKKEVRTLSQRNNDLLNVLKGPSKYIIGNCPLMEKVKRDIEKVAPTDAAVLILGENGTGKDLIANEIHQQSLRHKEAYICVDMGSLNDNLFESELFGHIKGAYTGAQNERIGRFELSQGGSIFLDEIGNISLTQQSKLLRAIENKSITKIGSNQSIPINVRIISATNKPIYSMIENNEFRQDLLFRINTIEIHLPSLRDRVNDIPLLLTHFLEVYGQKYGKDFKKPNQKLIQKLKAYTWPGNIRELQHWVERAVIMSESNKLDADDFQFQSQKDSLPSTDHNNLNLSNIEKQTIIEAMTRNGGNITRTANDLNISRFSLYRKLNRYNLKD